MGLIDKIFRRKIKVVRVKDDGNFIERYYRSFCHAVSGFFYALRVEHNMIIMVIAAIVTISAGFYFNISEYEWLFCIAIIAAIMASEMLNTAIEATIDLVTTEIHPLAKIAKDCASTASLILAIAAFVGALIIFLPKILILF